MKRRVFITGIGAVSALGDSQGRLWQNLLDGLTGIAEDHSMPSLPCCGRVALAERTRLNEPKHARILNRSSELLLAAASLARRDARWTEGGPPHFGTLVAIGSGDIEIDDSDLVQLTTPYSESTSRSGRGVVEPLRRLKHLPNIPACLLSIESRAAGQVLTLMGSDCAGLQAIEQAFELLATGTADRALCGATDSQLTTSGLDTFSRRTPVASRRSPCAPFSHSSTGAAPAEGAAVLTLEVGSDAGAFDRCPYAEILASASSSVATGGIRGSMAQCARSDGRAPDVLFAHGDGTNLDRLESNAICDCFGETTPPTTSVKHAIGHTMSACGAFNVLIACLALRDQMVPGVPATDTPHRLSLVHGVRQHLVLKTALCSAIDSSGVATSLLVAAP